MAMPQDVDARKYYRVAMQRLDEAELVFDNLSLFRAAVYLGGYAIECMLKALMLHNTAAGQRQALLKSLRRDFGHNLQLLTEGLRARGVNIPRAVVREITYATSWSPELRYEPGPGNRDEASDFLSAAKTVVKWADGGI